MLGIISGSLLISNLLQLKKCRHKKAGELVQDQTEWWSIISDKCDIDIATNNILTLFAPHFS